VKRKALVPTLLETVSPALRELPVAYPAVVVWHSTLVPVLHEVVSQAAGAGEIVAVGEKSVAAKFNPVIVTLVPPVVGAFCVGSNPRSAVRTGLS
jgi:hypothetical protein